MKVNLGHFHPELFQIINPALYSALAAALDGAIQKSIGSTSASA